MASWHLPVFHHNATTTISFCRLNGQPALRRAAWSRQPGGVFAKVTFQVGSVSVSAIDHDSMYHFASHPLARRDVLRWEERPHYPVRLRMNNIAVTPTARRLELVYVDMDPRSRSICRTCASTDLVVDYSGCLPWAHAKAARGLRHSFEVHLISFPPPRVAHATSAAGRLVLTLTTYLRTY